MADRTDLLESALDSLAEGVALADADGRVAFWNRAANEISGYSSIKLVGQTVRDALDILVVGGAEHWISHSDSATRGVLIHLRHQLGHDLPALARVSVLRDGMGGRIGTGVIFHPSESIDGLPHGLLSDDSHLEECQSQFEERLAALFEDSERGEIPLGVLWVTVDQARGLQRSHGTRACEAMLERLERTLANGLKPTEELGRWGDDEFLVVSHERNAGALFARAQFLGGLARTTDFRWWGDRVSLTVSVGAAQAERGESISQLLELAQSAMEKSVHAGGNHVTAAPGGQACLPS